MTLYRADQVPSYNKMDVTYFSKIEFTLKHFFLLQKYFAYFVQISTKSIYDENDIGYYTLTGIFVYTS